MTVTQEVDVALKITDARGNPAAVDGVPEWTVDNNLIVVTPTADGMSCKCSSAGGLGTSTVTATVDADLGAGVTPILGQIVFDLVAGSATVVELTPGTPTEQNIVTPLAKKEAPKSATKPEHK